MVNQIHAKILQRIEAVRNAIGDDIDLMVDANGKWDISIAKQYGHRLNDFNIKWFEEPLWHDDVASHKQLAAYMDTPIALGELLYHNDSFKEFVLAGAVDYLQPDATRCGGLAVWEIADLGMAFNLPVTPHHGDMMQAIIASGNGTSRLFFTGIYSLDTGLLC